jgi:hypothetical protein
LSQCRFQFEFPGSGTALVEKIRAKMTDSGGQFEGSDAVGSFSLPTPVGAFEGSYSIDKNTIWVEVTGKPIFVPCSAIEAKLMAIVKTERR